MWWHERVRRKEKTWWYYSGEWIWLLRAAGGVWQHDIMFVSELCFRLQLHPMSAAMSQWSQGEAR